MFAYIAGGTFVLQRIYGLSPQGFSLAFGINSVGIMTAAQVSGRLTRRLSPVRVLAVGLTVNATGSLCLAVSVLLGLGLPFVLGSLFVMVSAIGLILPTSTALALSNYPERAGTASALLGLLQYLVGVWRRRWSAWPGRVRPCRWAWSPSPRALVPAWSSPYWSFRRSWPAAGPRC